jgi:hypothetical protein
LEGAQTAVLPAGKLKKQAYVLRQHVKKYACHECEGSGDEDQPAVRTGKTPPSIMPGSIATPELLSFIFTKKYCDIRRIIGRKRRLIELGSGCRGKIWRIGNRKSVKNYSR